MGIFGRRNYIHELTKKDSTGTKDMDAPENQDDDTDPADTSNNDDTTTQSDNTEEDEHAVDDTGANDYNNDPDEHNTDDSGTTDYTTDPDDTGDDSTTDGEDTAGDGADSDYTMDGNSDDTDSSGDDMGDDSSTDDTSMDDTSGGQESELQTIEKDLFKDLTPDQLNIKNMELKQQFIETYTTVTATLTRIEKLSRDDSNVKVLSFVEKKLNDLKDLIFFYLNKTYNTNSYIQNNMILQQYLVVLNTVTEIINQIKIKEE